jgi:hypothetical protein
MHCSKVAQLERKYPVRVSNLIVIVS